MAAAALGQLRLDVDLQLIGELSETGTIGGGNLPEILQQPPDESALACKVAVAYPSQVRLAPRRGGIVLKPGTGGVVSRYHDGQDQQTPQSGARGGLGVSGGLGQHGERLRARHGEVGERLAIDRVARRFQAGDELPVRRTRSRARPHDSHNPQAPEVALFAGGRQRIWSAVSTDSLAER